MESECYRTCSFRLTQWLKIHVISHLIRSYYKPLLPHKWASNFQSLCPSYKLGHRFHALLKVCPDRDDIVPFNPNNPKPIKLQWLVVLYFDGLSTAQTEIHALHGGRVSHFHLGNLSNSRVAVLSAHIGFWWNSGRFFSQNRYRGVRVNKQQILDWGFSTW